MPENYSNFILPDKQTILDTKLETRMNFDRIFNQNPNYEIPMSDLEQHLASRGEIDSSGRPSISLANALTSDNEVLRNTAASIINRAAEESPHAQYKTDFGIKTPMEYAGKYMNKEFGFDPTIPDIEDFYYRNDYMADNKAYRWLVKNPKDFVGRVIMQAPLKFLEGLGYVGSMIGSIGSDNYWADVADNAFSKTLENAEQYVKDQILPIYKQAGFDQQGFFNKLNDAAFWNDSMADGVAFMASAFIPAGILGKVGKGAAWFSEGIAAGTRVGSALETIGLSTGREIATWTLNTAMEAAQEGAGVFKDSKRNILDLRSRGVEGYKDLTDAEVDRMAGNAAASTIGQNFMVLALSNAYENTLFFKRGLKGTDVRLAPDFSGESKALANLASKNPLSSALSRTRFYGKEALKGFAAEGLWEENAQLAIQRHNTFNEKEDNQSLLGRYFSQIKNAFSGNDQEAAESIGLGALIGIGAGIGFSKLHGERKSLIAETKRVKDEVDRARADLFSANDVYARDEKNNIIYENNQPKVDPIKVKAKSDELKKIFGSADISTIEELRNSRAADLSIKDSLATYVRALSRIGVNDISQRLSNLSPENAALFGIDPAAPSEKIGEFATLAKSFEQHSKDVDKLTFSDITSLNKRDKIVAVEANKQRIYDVRARNEVLGRYLADENSKLLDEMNKSYSLNNSSLDQYTVNKLNSLIYKKKLNEDFMKSSDFDNMSDLMKKHYTDTSKSLDTQIEEFKKNNDLALQEVEEEKGFFVAKNSSGNRIILSKEGKSAFRKIAEYENTIDSNKYIDSILSDRDNWYKNAEELKNTKDLREAAKNEQALNSKLDKSVFSKYQEKNEGDFGKVVNLVGRFLSGKEVNSTEDVRLQSDYEGLINDLIPMYEATKKSSYEDILESRRKEVSERRDALLEQVFEKNYRIVGENNTIRNLVEQVKQSLENGSANLGQLKRLLRKSQSIINKLEKEIAADEVKLAKLDARIEGIDNNISEGIDYFTETRDKLSVERQERVEELAEKKTLLSQLKKLIKDLVSITKSLFSHVDKEKLGKILDPAQNTWAWQNRKNYDEETIKEYDEAIAADEEVKLKEAEKKDLAKQIRTLEKEIIPGIDFQISRYNKILDEVEQETMARINQEWKQLTATPGNAANPVEKSLTETAKADSVGSIAINTIKSVNQQEVSNERSPDYVRPLETKFFTSTFSDSRVSELSKAEQDHFEFLDMLSDAKRVKEVRDKIGKGKLRVIAVTRNNVEKLGLKNILYNKKTSSAVIDNTKYWEDSDINNATVALVHVIEENGKLFYIDKDLNRLGEISKPSDKILYTILSATKFTDSQKETYIKDFGEDKMLLALEAGEKRRKQIFEETEKFTVESPTGVYAFDLTKGIQNNFSPDTKNSVVGILLNEDQINGHTVAVSKGDVIINNSSISMPKGVSYIKTKGISEKLHYADNNRLEDSHIDTILNVLYRLGKDYVSNLEESMKAKLNGKKISEIGYKEREKIMVEYNLSKGKKFNSNYFRYLNSIIYFDFLQKKEIFDDETGKTVSIDEDPNKNQVFIKGSKIFFGNYDLNIDMLNPESVLTNPEIRQFLQNQYHNIAYFSDDKIANSKYTEYYMDGNSLKSREWSTYNHYLLSPKLPSGENRSFIPITTKIKSGEQKKLEGKPEQPNYVSQAIILSVGQVEGAKREKENTSNNYETETTIEDAIAAGGTISFGKSLLGKNDSEEEATAVAKINKPDRTSEVVAKPEDAKPAEPNKKLSLLEIVRQASAKNKNEATEVKPEPEIGSGLAAFRKMIADRKAQETKDVTDDDVNNFIDGESPKPKPSSDRAFRVSTSGFFETEEDLDEVIAEAHRLLPQFPVIRLKNAIQTMDGKEAFGEFVDNTIRLWEGSEKGTIYHEMFEGVANRILSDAEWRSISREFRSRSGSFTERSTGAEISYKNASDHQIKEEIAEEFRTFKLTGKAPVQPNTKTFFQAILDFIRSFFQNYSSITDLFNQIDQGKLKDKTLRDSDRFINNYSRSILPIPIEDYRKFRDGATAFMFREIFYGNQDSLNSLDEVGDIDEVIYEKIKESIDSTFREIQRQIQPKEKGGDNIYPTNTTDPKRNSENLLKIKEAIANQRKWEAVKNDWGNFVKNHKIHMRHLSIKFNEEYDLSNEENDNKNRNDYTGNEFKLSAKNSASTSVKFLVGTLLKSKADSVLIKDSGIFPDLGLTYSSVYLPQLENYDTMMLTVLDKLKGANTINLLKERLEQVSGITKLREEATKDGRDSVIENMSSEESAMALLYNRLFESNLSKKSKYQLQAKLLSYSSKQSPVAHILMVRDGVSEVIESVNRPQFENIQKKVLSSIVHNITKIFDINRKNGVKIYTSSIKGDISLDDFIQGRNSQSSQKVKAFISFLGLDDIINKNFLLSLSDENRYNLSERLLKIRNAMKGVTFEDEITLKNLNIQGYISGKNGLLNFLNILTPIAGKSMQFMNGDNEKQSIHVQPSFISRIVDELNRGLPLDVLKEKFPQLKTSWAEDSIILQKLQKGYKVGLNYIEGMKSEDLDAGKFTKSSKMEMHERLATQMIMAMEGQYFTLPADSETEWMFNFGEFVSFRDNFLEEKENEIVNQIMLPKLKSEINMIYDFAKYSHLDQLNKQNNGRVIGKSLRFFDNILSAKTKEKIYDSIDNKNLPAEKVISGNKARIIEDINKYFDSLVEKTIDNARELRIINRTYGDIEQYEFQNLTSDLKDKFGGDTFSRKGLKDVIAYTMVNSTIANMEAFKVFFGDVAQYKDWEKRAKSLFSPVEQAVYDETGDFNEFLNTEENSAALGDEKVEIPSGDIFNISYKNHLVARTIDDITVTNPEVYESLSRLGASFKDTYEESNEADGQSVGTLQAGKQLAIKAGWRWTNKNEEFFQYDTALARKELSEQRLYEYSSPELRELDKKILENYKNNPPTDGLNPVKTLIPSVNEDGTQVLLKHSIYFISYQLAKGRELLPLYIDMLKRGDDILNFKSAQKVGLTRDNNGSITSLYEKNGNNINPFKKVDLASQELGNLPFNVSFRTLGIQVETQGSKKGQTLGTQLTKDKYLNLLPSGVAKDFLPGENLGNRIEAWSNLSEEEKMGYKDYRLMREGMTALENLKSKSVMDTFFKLGIRFNVRENGEIEYFPGDLKKLKQFIEDELVRLEVDSNTIESMSLTDDLKSFRNSAETLPSYNTIANVIWAVMDRSINSLKVNGKPYIQVASTFFNQESRKAAYKEGDKWITLNSQEEYDKAISAGKSVMMTSSDLKFYTVNEGDTETQGMEILLPHIYRKAINKKRLSRGLEPISDEDLMNYLNDNPKLLEGIGFRIPTQATSSLEFFKIKGFLPESFGSAVVVPSAITTKAGSDFDVDKLNTYLNNWKLDKSGMPVYEEMESSDTQRYINFIQEKEDEYNDIYKEMRASEEYKDRTKWIQENGRLVKGSREVIDEQDNEINDIYKEGSPIFKKLPGAVKQQFYEKEEELENDDITGTTKVLEYMNYTNEWLNQFKSAAALELPFKNKKGEVISTIVNSDIVIPILSSLLENQKRELEARGIKKEMWNEYLAIRKEKKESSDKIAKDYEFKLAKIIAEYKGLPTFESFAKLPIHLQNSRGAVENQYFQSIRNILKDPDRYVQLMSINTMDNIKENKEAVLKAKNPEYSAKNVQLNYANFLDINYLAEKRQAFVKGKSDIGIFAIGMTNYANSQVVGLGIAESMVHPDKQWIVSLNNKDFTLPFEEAETIEVNGNLFIPLSAEKDSEGKYIMDKLSGYINGAVDVAKEPDIVEMGMHTKLAGSYLILERAGIPGRKVALFMYQPIIREYLKEMIFLSSKGFGFSNFRGKKEIVDYLISKYNPSQQKFKQFNFTESELTEMIRNYHKNGNAEKFTAIQQQMQLSVLANFLKIEMYANDLRKNVEASNHDTNKIRSPYILYRKDLIAEELSTEGNTIFAPHDDGFDSGVKALRDKTFIGKTISTFKLFNNMFSEVNLFSLQKANPKSAIMRIGKKIHKSRSFLTGDEFDKMMKEVEVSLIDSLLNNRVVNAKDVKLSSYMKSFFTPETIDDQGNRKYSNNIYNSFNRIKENNRLLGEENFFLKNLLITNDVSLGIYTMEFKVKPMTGDVLTKDMLIEGWRELYTHENPEISKFANMMAVASILQYGMKYQRTSTSQFIPIEAYSFLTNAAFENIDNEDFSHLEEEVMRSNAWKKGMLEEVVPYSMKLLDKDGKLINRNSLKPFKEGDPSKPKLTQRAFYTRGEPIRPAFFYRGWLDEIMNVENDATSLPEYIKITIVDPDLVIKRLDEETGTPYTTLSRKVMEMTKKQDFSYKKTLVFKLVGADGTTPAVALKQKKVSGKNKGRTQVSYLYRPVNTTGARNVNEIVNLTEDDAGNITGKPSILKPQMKIAEETDSSIMESVMKNTTSNIQLVTYKPADIGRIEMEYIPEERVAIQNPGFKNISKIEPKDLPPIEPEC